MARIELINLEKVFGEQKAVRALNLTVADGELVVLLGPSGCGKSTTMNMIAGLLPPSSGSIVFDGREVTDELPLQRNIAMVFQSSLLYPHLTARQNIYMSLKRSGLSKAEIGKRIEDVAAVVDITRLLDKMPSQLSGGERQRVATAKAIVRQPACFLLDEPLAALDAALRMTLRSELVNLQKRLRTTMIFVTHDQVEAMTMGDRIGVMRNGGLEQIATPNDLYNKPDSLFVAGFIGSPPMNFLRGEAQSLDGRPTFVNGFARVALAGAYGTLAPRAAVTLAVRPQYMRIEKSGEGQARIPLTVYALEHLGNEFIVIADAPDGGKLRAVVAPGFEAKIGEVLYASFDPANALLFDQASERRIVA